MATAELMVALLAAVVILALLARRLRIAVPVVLVLGGFGLAALPFMPAARIDPDIVLLVFLPPILFPAALELAREELRPALAPVGLLAIGLVLATTAVVAVVAHVVLGLPWAAAVVLGAILGPTDPVAATSLLRSSGAPPRLATVLEGESLVNDGTSLTIFRVALGAVGASFSLGAGALDFVVIAVGGGAFGAAVGWVASELMRRFEETEIESALAVLVAYGSYVAAEAIGLSGILAVALAGLVIGLRISEITSPETRLRGGSFWSLLQFLAESTLFVLVGLVIGDELGAFEGDPWALVGAALAVTAATALTRVVWMFTVPYVARLRRRPPDPRQLAVLVLGGLRGAVSVAVALAIPMTVSGEPFPQRDTVILVALMSVVVLLVVPALALPPALRRLGVTDERAGADELDGARATLAEAALRRVDELAEGGEIPEELVRRAHDFYEARLASARHHGDEDGGARGEAYRRVLRELVEAEREELHRLEREDGLSGRPLRRLEHGLDLEERRLG